VIQRLKLHGLAARPLKGIVKGQFAELAFRCTVVKKALFAVLMMAAPFAATAGISVGPSGQASYSMPISVPPGIAGMAPNLSLTYSDGGINGPLGVGWSLQGLSMITRCGASKVVDGKPRAVDFTAADKLCLDGQRLIQTDSNGQPLAAQVDDALGLAVGGVREFRTEKDSFARIRAYGSAGGLAANGPAYFKVWTKSGQLYEYGANSSDASDSNALILTRRVTPVPTGTIPPPPAAMVWASRRVSDTLGNYIDFKYTQRPFAWGSGPVASGIEGDVGREWNVAEVQYTGTTAAPASAPRNKIVFDYENRPTGGSAASGFDRSEAYQLDNKNVSVQRLRGIIVYINSPTPVGVLDAGRVAVRNYKIAYENSPTTGRSRLLSVTECSGETVVKCLPASKFSYSTGTAPAFLANGAFVDNSTLATEKLTDSTTGNYGVLTGDFNGDGRTDILRWASNAVENRMYFSTGGGNFEKKANFTLAGSNHILFKPDGCYYSIVADFNGDGLSDILRVAKPSVVSLK
jgi:Salmonella virulence plasmid 65kDa B protein/FG-GAP-like repeat